MSVSSVSGLSGKSVPLYIVKRSLTEKEIISQLHSLDYNMPFDGALPNTTILCDAMHSNVGQNMMGRCHVLVCGHVAGPCGASFVGDGINTAE